MCELYGFSGGRERTLNSELSVFFSHSDKNPHGWGFAAFSESERYIQKEALSAYKSENVKSMLNKPIAYKNAVAHIRLATIGLDEYNNSHPFFKEDNSGRMWTLIHNGTIFESDLVAKYIYSQNGATDSERVLLFLIDSINEKIAENGRALSKKERFDVVDNTVSLLSPKNKLNLIIYDGEQMYVHTNYKNTLYYYKSYEGVTFSTTPLNDENWQPFPMMTVVAFENGKVNFTGECHNNEYIPDEKSIRALYMAYSIL